MELIILFLFSYTYLNIAIHKYNVFMVQWDPFGPIIGRIPAYSQEN